MSKSNATNGVDNYTEIFLEKKIINNPSLSLYGLMAYIALRCLYQRHSIICVDNYSLYFALYNKLCKDKQGVKLSYKIRDGVQELIDNKIVDLVDAADGIHFVLDISNIYINKNKYYIKPFREDIVKILNVTNIDREKVLRYYFYILCNSVVVDKNIHTRVMFKPLNEISAKTQRDVKTLQSYNELLESLEIIYVYRYEDYICIDGKLKRIPNLYGRYCDKEKILDIAKNYEEFYVLNNKKNYKRKDKKEARKNKSWAIKFNYYLKGYYYSYEDLETMYFTLRELNKNPANKRKDLTVFKDYDFYVGDKYDRKHNI